MRIIREQLPTIVFDLAKDNRIIIEKENYSESIFAYQYGKALSLLSQSLVVDDSDKESRFYPNIIAFCGDRGEGKTSCMLSVRHIVSHPNEKEARSFLDREQFKIGQDAFETLEVIDPSHFDVDHDIIDLVLGLLYSRFKDYIKKLRVEERHSFSCELVTKAFNRVKECRRRLKDKEGVYLEPLEELEELSAGMDLSRAIEELFDSYLQLVGKKKLLICIDDMDFNMTGAYGMAQQIQKYLDKGSCVIMLSVKVNQLVSVINTDIEKNIEYFGITDEEVPRIAGKFVQKMLPLSNRIEMPRIAELCLYPLKVCKGTSTREWRTVKDAVVSLIFRKTRYLFYNTLGTASKIVPTNLRLLRQLIGILYEMPDFKKTREVFDLRNNENNKRTFRSYFYGIWPQVLIREDRRFVEELVKLDDVISINKFVVSYINKRAELGSSIDDPAFFSFNISVADVFNLIEAAENSNSQLDIHSLCFFIRSFYSIRLYEYYDEVSESQDALQPSGEVLEVGVYKADHWYKRTNILQSFVNGAYFLLDTNERLYYSKGKEKLDLSRWSIAGRLSTLIRKTDFKKYEEEQNKEEKAIFEQNFRMLEFILLTLSHTKPSGSVNQMDVVRRKSYPYYLEPFDVASLDGYIIDPLSIFYNIINVQYAYNRFGEQYQFYQFAISHSWTLLSTMLSEVSIQIGNRKGNPILNLASDAIIRNGDVLSSINAQIHEFIVSGYKVETALDLLIQLYSSIINPEMTTYSVSDDEKEVYQISFSFLNSLIKVLKTFDPVAFENLILADYQRSQTSIGTA